VAARVAGGNAEQLPFHLNRARENGVTEAELIDTITHLAFNCGGPKAMSHHGRQGGLHRRDYAQED
jgi:4-carboxymuconolactone decarboxylase